MRENLTIHRTVNALLQKLNPNQREWILLVEGKSDKLLFGKFVIKEKVEIQNCDGWTNLLEIVNILRERKIDKFIGVLDKDFRELDGDLIEDPQLFFTDFHDIELSILESRAFETVLSSHENEDKRKNFESKSKKSILQNLYDLCKNLGYLKWSNKTYELGLVFKPVNPEGNPVSYDKFIDKQNLIFISDDVMITHLMQYSINRKTTIKPKSDIEAKYNEFKGRTVDLRQLCNGHDMCHVLSLALKKVIGGKTVPKETLEKELILAYDSTDFKLTTLYSKIQDWESKNSQIFA